MLKFEFQDMCLCVDDEVQNYAIVLVDNLNVQEQMRNKFSELYHKYQSMDTAVSRMLDDLYELLNITLDSYANQWISKGALDLTTDIFIRDYYKPLCSGNGLKIDYAYDQIMDAYNDIVMTQEQKMEYRKMRKNSRSRWVGGGFGLGGAIKGAATAGMLNAASGIGHGIFNTIENIGTGIATAKKKRKLYEAHDTLQCLLTALSDDIFRAIKANINYGNKRFGIEYKLRYSDEVEKANAILGNLEKRQMEDNEYKEIIKQLFELDPYNIHFYKQTVLRLGDDKQELQRMADFFGCGRELKMYKNKILEDMVLKPESEDLVGYQKLLENLKPRIEYYGIDEKCSPVLEKIQDKYNRLELAARTFEEVTYQSIQEAEAAKEEKQRLEKVFTAIQFTGKESIKQGLLELRNYNAELYPKDKYLEKIETVLKDEIMGSVNILDKTSILQAKDELVLAEFQMISIKDEITELENNLENFDTNFRTVEGVLYHTDVEANGARAELNYCDEMINKIDVNNEESILATLDILNSHDFQYINVKKYLELLRKMLEDYYIKSLPEKIDGFLEQRDFNGAWQFLMMARVPENVREKEKNQLNQKAKRLLVTELKQAKEYEETGMGNTIMGAITILVISTFLTSIFPFAFPIACVICVMGIIGNMKQAKERKSWKQSYDLIMELKKIGYTF